MLGVEENKKTKRVRYLICFFVFQCTCNSTNVLELEDTLMLVSLMFMSTLLSFFRELTPTPLSLMPLSLMPLSLVGAQVLVSFVLVGALVRL